MSAPAVAVSHDGRRFAVAWKDIGIGEPNVYWAISNGPSFAEDPLVHDKIWGTQDHPAIAIDTAGTAWTAWEDERSHLHLGMLIGSLR